MNEYNFSCIILAAGSGTRFGSKKQYLELNNTPLWQIVYNKCKQVSKDVVVVGVDVPGGDTRQSSVKIGLDHITKDRVVILEAARPLVLESQILSIANSLSPSISLFSNTVDTVYSLKLGYIDREFCMNLQVPQAFNSKILKEAHKKTKRTNATDDTILMHEEFGILPEFLLGGENLFKVTYPADIFVLENLCKKYPF